MGIAFWASALAADVCAETFRDGDRVCFFGDSLTQGGGWHRNVILYYATRFPDRAVSFVNSGWGGDNAGHAGRERLEPDVVAHRPDAVVVMFGMNDFGFWTYGPRATAEQVVEQGRCLDKYAQNMAALVDGLKARLPDARLYLMTPTPFDDAGVYKTPVNEHLGAGGGLVCASETVARLAERTGATLVDQNLAVSDYFRRARAADDAAVFAADRIHVDAPTGFVMAHRFLEAQNAPRVVSDVRLQDGRAVGLRNASVSDVSWQDGRVAFTLLEKALPWPVGPEEARGGEAIRAVAADFNRETLTVYGLKDGLWTLSIDGAPVLSASARQWTVGVDLGGNDRTPQYRQALDVWRENRRLHERMGQVQATNVRLIRSLSEQMRRQALNPDDAEARTRFIQSRIACAKPWDVRDLERVMVDWTENARLFAAVDAEWPKLRARATPRPHRYELAWKATADMPR